MPPLGFSLLAPIVDASRLSERLFLSSVICSVHISPPFICLGDVWRCLFPPFSSYTAPSPSMLGSSHSDSVYSDWIFCLFSSAGACPPILTHLSLTSISLCHLPSLSQPFFFFSPFFFSIFFFKCTFHFDHRSSLTVCCFLGGEMVH